MQFKPASLSVLALAFILPLILSCSDDRPVGDSLEPAKDVEDLIAAMYKPAERDAAAKRLARFSKIIYRRLMAEVADNGKSSPDEVAARVMMLEMISRVNAAPEIDGLLIRIARDSGFPDKLRRAAEESSLMRENRF